MLVTKRPKAPVPSKAEQDAARIRYGATIPVELEFDELGPNSLFGLHVELATCRHDGRTVRILGAVNGAAACFDFGDDRTFPKGPITSRRVVVTLESIMQAVAQYVDKFPVPPRKEEK